MLIIVVDVKSDQVEIKAFKTKFSHNYIVSIFMIMEHGIITVRVESRGR